MGTAVVTHELGDIAHAWNQLARRSGTPFVTHEWLGCWWTAFGEGEPMWLSLRGDNGALEAGAFLERGARDVTSAANVHSVSTASSACCERITGRAWSSKSRPPWAVTISKNVPNSPDSRPGNPKACGE